MQADYNDPTFQEKFVSTLVDGLRELNLAVRNGNVLAFKDFVGTDKVIEVLKLDQEMEDLAKLLIAGQSFLMFG